MEIRLLSNKWFYIEYVVLCAILLKRGGGDLVDTNIYGGKYAKFPLELYYI